MFVFGHTGLTLGSALILTGLLSRYTHAGARTGEHVDQPADPPADTRGGRGLLSGLARFVDIRLLLVGALLPDIIDKPLGWVFLRETFANGRIYGHTLLFGGLIAVAGVALYAAGRRTWLLALAFGTLAHLVLDGMWLNQRTLFWPLFGLSFGRTYGDTWFWIEQVWQNLRSEPWIALPEVLGFVIIAWLAWTLLRRRGLLAFLKNGRV